MAEGTVNVSALNSNSQEKIDAIYEEVVNRELTLQIIENKVVYGGGVTHEITMESDIEIVVMQSQGTGGDAIIDNGSYLTAEASSGVSIIPISQYDLMGIGSVRARQFIVQGKKGLKYSYTETRTVTSRIPYLTRYGVN